MKHILFILFFTSAAEAKIKTLVTTTDLNAIVKEVGGDEVETTVVCKGNQDPHHIEAKPSFMLEANRADLLVSNGLSLEVGWLPAILNGARNSKISEGSSGNFVAGKYIESIEIPKLGTSRADGDVHPEGNPHFTLDPIRVGKVAIHLANHLAKLDPKNEKLFLERATKLKNRLEDKTTTWKKRIQVTGIKKVITYHKTLNYFLERFGIENVAILETKPGVPPTGPHILEVIQITKEQKVPLILVENFFNDSVASRIKADIPSVKIASIAVSIEGEPSIKTIDDVYENIVKKLETR